MDAFTLDPTRVRDLSSRLLDDRGRLQVVPARELATTTPQERLLFGVRHGLYGFATNRPEAGGSATGVDEAAVVAACDEYIFIGNERVHAHKPIWALPQEKLTPPWLYSRAVNGSADFVAI